LRDDIDFGDLSLAEEITVLARRRPRDMNADDRRRFGVCGAVLMEWALSGCVVLRDGRLAVGEREDVDADALRIGAETGAGPAAAGLWRRIRAEEVPLKPVKWIAGHSLAEPVQDRLVERGILRAERRRVLGLFPATRWVEADPAPAAAIRQRVTHGGPVDDRTRALFHLAVACGYRSALLPAADSVSGRERFARLAESPWENRRNGATVRALADSVEQAVRRATAITALLLTAGG